MRCNKCGQELKKSDTKEVFYIICEHCKNQVVLFVPYEISQLKDSSGSTVVDPSKDLSMQELAYADTTKYKFLVGGYNTGKTTIDAFEVFMHLINIPMANYVVGANTLNQLEKTFMVEFMRFCSPTNIVYKNLSNGIYVLRNGSTLHLVPTDDEEKIKSMNLTGASLIEASGQDYEIFLQLKRRLRNKAAVIYDYDENGNIKLEYDEKKQRTQYKVKHSMYTIIVETNPEDCWIYEEEFPRAGKVFANIHRYPHSYTVTNPKRTTSFYIFDTMDNPYADGEYIDDIIEEGIESVNTKIHGVLAVKQGYVFRELMEKYGVVIPDREIQDDYVRAKAMDFGYNDPTTMAKTYIDPKSGAIVGYDEYYKQFLLIPQHTANLLPEIKKENEYGIRTYGGILGDSSGKNRNFYDSNSTFTQYKQLGIHINQASNAQIETGIDILKTLMSQGQLKIFASCRETIREFRDYRYKPIKKDEQGRAINKSNDTKFIGSDHLLDTYRYIVHNLELDPMERIKQVYGSAYYNQEFLGKSKEVKKYEPDYFGFRNKKKGRSRSYGY